MQIRRRFQQPADGEIEIARLQESEQLGVERHVKLHLRGGALDDEARQERLADEPRHHVPGADAHFADLARRQLRDLAFGVVQRDARLSARARSAAPIGVSSTPRGARMNSCAPTCASSRCRLRVSAGWLMPRARPHARDCAIRRSRGSTRVPGSVETCAKVIVLCVFVIGAHRICMRTIATFVCTVATASTPIQRDRMQRMHRCRHQRCRLTSCRASRCVRRRI